MFLPVTIIFMFYVSKQFQTAVCSLQMCSFCWCFAAV